MSAANRHRITDQRQIIPHLGRWMTAALLVGSVGCTAAADKPDVDTNPDVVRNVVCLQEPNLIESSGLAVSNSRANRWWTHNDSGDKARLFAFDQTGKKTGECRLTDFQADDWEDMASYTIGGRPRLILADCGDNVGKRKSISLYLFDEPDPNDQVNVDHVQELSVTYSDGPRDCEAIAVDTVHRQIVLVAKSALPLAGVYAIDLPDPSTQPTKSKTNVIAKRISTLTIPMISAMDIDPVNGDIWVVNYFQAFRFKRSDPQQELRNQFAALPQVIDLPKWRQIEAVAVDQSHQVWITSEGKSSPLGRLNQSPK
ncbi:MAG: hypothetical protein HKN47_05700 [Pirellulaceae bacterium]|nr:hypothetical protein [Pirellulaceae bacterium]